MNARVIVWVGDEIYVDEGIWDVDERLRGLLLKGSGFLADNLVVWSSIIDLELWFRSLAVEC